MKEDPMDKDDKTGMIREHLREGTMLKEKKVGENAQSYNIDPSVRHLKRKYRNPYITRYGYTATMIPRAHHESLKQPTLEA